MAQLQQLNVALTGTAAAVTGLPPSVRYLRVHNPSSSHALAYTLDGSTPVINGNGFTVGGSAPATDVIDLQAGGSLIPGSYPSGVSAGPVLTMIGATTQTATLAYSV